MPNHCHELYENHKPWGLIKSSAARAVERYRRCRFGLSALCQGLSGRRYVQGQTRKASRASQCAVHFQPLQLKVETIPESSKDGFSRLGAEGEISCAGVQAGFQPLWPLPAGLERLPLVKLALGGLEPFASAAARSSMWTRVRRTAPPVPFRRHVHACIAAPASTSAPAVCRGKSGRSASGITSGLPCSLKHRHAPATNTLNF